MAPDRVKHLEMIQAVVARLGTDSFLVKGWAVAAAGVLLGFAINNDQPWLALPSVLVTVMLWVLDSYYLRSERLFRLYYDRVRDPTFEQYEPFAMNATAPSFVDSLQGSDRDRVARVKVAVSGTLAWLYVALVLAAAGAALVTVFAIDPSGSAQGGANAVGCVCQSS
jgi:hypothetical protein